jgi:hypothetical protein
MSIEELAILRSYVHAWKRWNEWLIACNKPEIDFSAFMDRFPIIDHDKIVDTGYGTITGRFDPYDVDIDGDGTIFMSKDGLPCFSWSYHEINQQDPRSRL